MTSPMTESTRFGPGLSHAIIGVLCAFVGGLFIAQAGGSDGEFFVSAGFLFAAAGLLEIVVGGVAIGVRLARH